jgi:SP family arabinose:H+ symporter-like MFS transporter
MYLLIAKMGTGQETNRSYLFFIAITAALGGFLFGYDTAVISGTIGFVKAKFLLNTAMEGWFVSSALVGCIAGVAVTGELSDRFGRKYSLIASGLLFSISAIGCALSGSHTQLIVYRLIGGVGVGVASMLSPLYISEVSPARIRGRMVALYQFAITLGILCAYFANALMLNLSESLTSLDPVGMWHRLFVAEVWRAMFGSEAVPALLFFVTMFFVPSSPRWLSTKNRNEEAGRILERINNREIAERELESIKMAIARESAGSWRGLLQKGILVAVLAGIGLALLSQFTGINAIIYYGPRIMEEAGIQLSDALGGQVIIGFVNMAATIYAILKIDRYGRKKLMQGGITGMFLSLIIVGVLFLLGKTQGVLLLVFILTFITSFAIGYGPVIWVLLSEIYPTKVRGRAMSVATLAVWVGTAIIGQVVPWMLETLTPAGTFFVFAVCCIPVPFILRKVPETKGLSLEEIEEVWQTH